MLRSAAIVVGLLVASVVVPGAVPMVWAQPHPTGFAPPDPLPPPAAAGELLPGEPRPGSVMRQPEHLQGRPSGFWTSTRPAVGGAYRYRILGMGLVALAITGIFLMRLLRRANATSIRTRAS